MKQTPLLYTAPMVRAQLSGEKTQTRRLVKGMALGFLSDFEPAYVALPENHLSRYGYAGDLVWGRETSRAIELESGLDGVRYEADGAFRPIEATMEAAEDWVVMHNYRHGKGLVVPSIHMPRWASRLERTLTSVSIERLQAISDADAVAEGIEEWMRSIYKDPDVTAADVQGMVERFGTGPRAVYAALWESINGIGSWKADPYVWRLSWA